MKTELIRNFSTASLAAIARSDSNLSTQTDGSDFITNTNDEFNPSNIGSCCSDFFSNVFRRKTVSSNPNFAKL